MNKFVPKVIFTFTCMSAPKFQYKFPKLSLHQVLMLLVSAPKKLGQGKPNKCGHRFHSRDITASIVSTLYLHKRALTILNWTNKSINPYWILKQMEKLSFFSFCQQTHTARQNFHFFSFSQQTHTAL